MLASTYIDRGRTLEGVNFLPPKTCGCKLRPQLQGGRMDRRAFLGATAASLTASRAAADPPLSLRMKVVGVWTLAEAVTVDGEQLLPWFGRTKPVRGLLMYAENGWMSVQITGFRPGKISRDDYLSLSNLEKFDWMKEYYGYYRTYEVEEAKSQVTHSVMESLTVYERSTLLVRQVLIDGDTLTSLTEPRTSNGRTTSNRLTWKRAPPA